MPNILTKFKKKFLENGRDEAIKKLVYYASILIV